jgi:hypothetical protein
MYGAAAKSGKDNPRGAITGGSHEWNDRGDGDGHEQPGFSPVGGNAIVNQYGLYDCWGVAHVYSAVKLTLTASFTTRMHLASTTLVMSLLIVRGSTLPPILTLDR